MEKQTDTDSSWGHRHKALLAVLAVIVAIIIAVCMVIIIFSDDGAKKEASNQEGADLSASTPEGTELDGLIDDLQSNGGEGDTSEKIAAVVEDQNSSSDDKKEALDALADSCFLAQDIGCLEDLKKDYEAADIEAVNIQNLIDEVSAAVEDDFQTPTDEEARLDAL